MEIPKLHKVFLQNRSIATDSRNISPGSIYFALSGERFNGNDFALEALEKGASYAVVDHPSLINTARCIYVNNTLETLQKLGTFHRNHCKATVISLTGSNGKTTTKELIYQVLKTSYNTIATVGNLNNHIGVPLSLLRIGEETEFAVIEMGANHQKEIAFLSELAQPDLGCITNFGKAHLEGFGGVEGVIKGKSELYDYLIKHQKPILYNSQDPIQRDKISAYAKGISFGNAQGDTFFTEIKDSQTSVRFSFENTLIETSLYGAYNATNCMIAASIGAHFKITTSKIKQAIEAYLPNNNRSELKKIGAHEVVLDAYNANPTSMEVAIAHFSELSHEQHNNKIVFLGDMFELGETAAREHQNIVFQLEKCKLQSVYLIGKHFHQTKHSFKSYPDFESFQKEQSLLRLGPSLILIKGSRGMALERIIPLIAKENI